MAAKKKPASLGDKVKKILKDTAKQTGKDLLTLGTIVGPGKAVKGASMVAKARAGQQVSSKVAKKVGDKISGETSKKVQGKLHKIAMKDANQTARLNKDLDGYGAYLWSKHPAMVSGKGFDRAVNKGKVVTDRQSVRYRKAEDKLASKALKAANKPTNKVGSKADKALRARAKSVSMSKDQAVRSYDAMYGKGTGKTITQINKRVVPKNEARSIRQLPKKKK